MKFVTHVDRGNYGSDISHDEDLKPRFTQCELDILWHRFRPLDNNMQSDLKQYVPGFQSGPMAYYFEEMPSDVAMSAFMASWHKN